MCVQTLERPAAFPGEEVEGRTPPRPCLLPADFPQGWRKFSDRQARIADAAQIPNGHVRTARWTFVESHLERPAGPRVRLFAPA